jgi:CHAD domain-containing protein
VTPSPYNSPPVAQEFPLWQTRARSLQKAGKQFRESSPDGIHDLRVALRRVSATASALGRDKLAKKSRRLVSYLSDLRQIEVDRQLLGRVRELGWIPEQVAAGVDASWDALLKEGARTAARRVPEQALDRLRRKLSRLSRGKQENLLRRLEDAREAADRLLEAPPQEPSDKNLHRYRLAVKKARYVTEDLALAGRAGLELEIERKKRLQDALGHWNDLRLFRRHLASTRDEAEKRGAVSFVVELDRVIAALKPAVLSARSEALRVVRSRAVGRPARSAPPRRTAAS